MTEILLLNASDEPMTVITWKRALSLLIRGCVEAATQSTWQLSGVSETWNIPTVLRLRHQIRLPRHRAPWSRRAVLRRDRYTCAYCGLRVGDAQGQRILKASDFTIDHVLPVSRGGENSWNNTVCACFACNQRKADHLPQEAQMELAWEPETPTYIRLIFARDVPSAWKAFLTSEGAR